MKKFFSLLLAVLMVASIMMLAACNNNTPSDPDDDKDQPGNVDPSKPSNPSDDGNNGDNGDNGDDNNGDDNTPDEDQKEADKVIERINKIGEITIDTWSDNESKIKYARKYYDKLTDAQKALIDASLVEKLETAEKAYAEFLAADEIAQTLTVNKIACASCVIDGSLDGYYVMGTALTKDQVTIRFAYDKEYLYIYAENKTGTEDITVRLARNTALVGNISLTTAGVTVTPADSTLTVSGNDPVQVSRVGDGYTVEVAIALDQLGLKDDHFEDNEIGVTFACGSVSYKGYDDLAQCERFYTSDAAFYNYIASGTPTVDGEIDELYLKAHSITLSQDVVQSFTKTETSYGAGWAGDKTLTEAADMKTTFRFAVDDKYLYIVEHRVDMYPIYGSTAFTKPYWGDGSLLWFSKDGTLGAGICWNRAIKDYAGPTFGLFFNNAQAAASQKNWEFAVKQYGTLCEYVMELKVPLSDLELTRADFEDGRIGFTFCTVDVVNENYDANNFSWDGNAYQMQYVGVNNWAHSPVLLINPTDSTMSSMPIMMGDYAPEYAMEFDTWDPTKSGTTKPFDVFPVNAETGYMEPKSDWTIGLMDEWYRDDYANLIRYNLDRDQLPSYEDGITVTPEGNPSWKGGTGYYCDAIGSCVTVAVDLTKYKDAMVIISTGQNNVVEISSDGENWTEVYNYIKVHTTPTKDTLTRYGLPVDSAVYAQGADTLYVRVGQAKTEESGWGGMLTAFTVLYN